MADSIEQARSGERAAWSRLLVAEEAVRATAHVVAIVEQYTVPHELSTRLTRKEAGVMSARADRLAEWEQTVIELGQARGQL